MSKTFPLIAEAEEQRQREMLIGKVEALQNMLLSQATDGYRPGTPQHDQDSELYANLRREFTMHPTIKARLPRFVSTCRDLTQFRRLMQSKSPHYRERREHICKAFRPLLDALEGPGTTPADMGTGEVLASFDAEGVHRVWERAPTAGRTKRPGTRACSHRALRSEFDMRHASAVAKWTSRRCRPGVAVTTRARPEA